MSYAYVTTNLLDLRAEPDHGSERVNQVPFSEPVEVIRDLHGFSRVVQADGYRGWCSSGMLKAVDKAGVDAWRKHAGSIVISPEARVYGTLGGTEEAPFLLYYGTRLCTKQAAHGFSQVVLPDQGSLYVKVANIAPISKEMTTDSVGAMVVREARRFIGVPYLWGGISPAGFDCSGFVRAVFARFGIELPRDTCDQIMIGKQVPQERTRIGDLLFFERHVGLAIGRTRLIHASLGGGGVRVNSLTPGGEDYREDLHRAYAQTRRVIP